MTIEDRRATRCQQQRSTTMMVLSQRCGNTSRLSQIETGLCRCDGDHPQPPKPKKQLLHTRAWYCTFRAAVYQIVGHFLSGVAASDTATSQASEPTRFKAKLAPCTSLTFSPRGLQGVASPAATLGPWHCQHRPGAPYTTPTTHYTALRTTLSPANVSCTNTPQHIQQVPCKRVHGFPPRPFFTK